jgi:flagellar hook assembly protein FlgD
MPVPGAFAPLEAPARLTVYDLSGRSVRTLFSGRLSPDGRNVAWDGTDTAGRRLGSGIYLVVLRCGAAHAIQRVTLVR